MSTKNRLLSIGEAASSLGITRRMILNYEERGLLRADVKEGAKGNRYYTPDSLSRIHIIRVFQKLGLSLDDIRDYLDDSSDLVPLIARLESLRDELNLNIEKLRERVKDSRGAAIYTAEFPRQTVYRRTIRTESLEARKEHLRDIIPFVMREYGFDNSCRMFFTEFPLNDANLVTYCIAVPEGSKGECIVELPKTQAICTSYHGNYDGLLPVRESLIATAEERGLALAGICRHNYIEGPAHHNDPQRYITQVALLLAQADAG